MSEIDRFNQQVSRIAIIGTGLLGASLGLGLRKAGYRGVIVGIGRRHSTVDRALDLGCIDEATIDLGLAVQVSQLVVLATPLSRFAPLLEQLAQHDHTDLVVTDVGSTKQQVCADAERLLPDPSRFVGSHPMAGSERHGPEHAQADLFANRPCIMTPHPHTDAGASALVKTLWTVLGMKLIEMSPAEHDRKTACISHLPHAVAALLVGLAAKHQALDVASTGFAGATRVASGDPQVWLDIFSANRRQIISAIDDFTTELTSLRRLLDDDEDDSLLAKLQKSKQQRDAWYQTIEGVAG